jgi:uncharacterized membrane protein
MTAVRPAARWPPVLALVAIVGLPLLLPQHLTVWHGWIVSVVGGLLLVCLAVISPSRTGRRTRLGRGLIIALTVVLIASAAFTTVRLTVDLVKGGPTTNSPDVLLSSGALVWINNSILFGLLYWELDRQGRGFAFPQQLNPEVSPPGWQPSFVDYFYVGITNGLAFSPTDTMPLVAWSKMTMAAQSLVSFVVVGLVIARAVNIFT